MAERPTSERPTSDTPLLEGGVYQPTYKDDLTGRQDPFLGGTRDTLIDVGTSAIDVLSSPFSYLRDAGVASKAKSMEAAGQLGQRTAIGIKDWMRRGKTEFGQQEDRTGNENRSWLGAAIDMAAGSVPPVIAAVSTGPYAPLTYGALAGGQQSTDFEEKLYNMPREELEKSPVYQQFKHLGHLEAVRAVHNKMRQEPWAWGPNVAANVLFGGVAARVINKFGSRTIAQSMTQSIMRNVAQDVPEGVVGGALTGVGQSYGRQRGEMAGGIREAVDWGEVGKEAWEIGSTVGGISSAAALARSRRPRSPAAPPAADDTLTPPIGIEQRLAATENLADSPGAPPPLPPGAGAAGTTPPPPTGAGAAGTTPPPPPPGAGAPAAINPEGATARVTPAGTTPPVDTIPPAAGVGATGTTPALWDDNGTLREVEVPPDSLKQVGETHQREIIIDGERKLVPFESVKAKPEVTPVVETLPVAEAAPAAGATTAVTPEVAPEVVPFTREQLRERIRDLTRTPTHDDFLAAVDEWKKANPKERLGEQGKLAAEHGALRKAARRQAQEDKVAANARAREAKETFAAHAKLAREQSAGYAKAAREQAEKLRAKDKPEAKPEVVTQEGKPAPEAKPEVVVVDEPPNVNRVRLSLGLKPRGDAVVHGAAAAEGISKAAEEKKERSFAARQVVEEGEVKADVTAKDTEGAATRREDDYSAREETARKVMEMHQPGGNLRAELDRIEGVLKDNEADSPTVRKEVETLVTDIAQIVTDYNDRLKVLTGDKKTDMVLKSKSKSGRTRAGKGEYRNFMSDLNNLVIDINNALKAGNTTRAKELTLKYLEDSKRVREGEIAKVGEARKERSDAISVEKRTHAQGEAVVKLTKAEVEALNPADREIYEAQVRSEQREATKGDEADKTKTGDQLAEADERLKKNPVKPFTKQQAKSQGMRVPKRDAKGNIIKRFGKIVFEDPTYPTSSLYYEDQWTNKTGPDPIDADKLDNLQYELFRFANDAQETHVSVADASDVFRIAGEKIEGGKLGEILAQYRPDNEFLQKIFDAVFDAVKDMPFEVWSHDMMEAYYRQNYDQPAALGMYDVMSGRTIYRADAIGPITVFHEALHAATSRALRGSERLNKLVARLQDVIEARYKTDLGVTGEFWYQRAIRKPGQNNQPGERVNAREFVAELFSRPEVAGLLGSVNLTRAEAAALNKLGYRADIGQSIMKTLWEGILKALGFKPDNPNALKVGIDLLQDMFEREMAIRETDEIAGRRTGQLIDAHDMQLLYNEDKVGGPAAVKAWQAGDYVGAAEHLLAMNEKGVLDVPAADAAIKMLHDINGRLWEDPSLPMEVTPVGNSEQVRRGVSSYLDDRFGDSVKNAGFQFQNKFRTPLRKFFSGMQYTNDIGNTLGDAFKAAIRPLKVAWSKREHYAQEYMDKSGANKLIDDLATLKHEIADRKLWNIFENLLIRESYSKAYADQPLGVGRNEHVKAGELKWRQTEKDYKANVELLRQITARSPKLAAMRQRIFEFSRRELDQRMHHQTVDMLLREGIVKHGDDVGISAMAKNIRRLDTTMTPEEKKAYERIVGTDTTSKAFKAYTKQRDDIRTIIDSFHKAGPHVPFMRHGKHAVFAEYHVTPDQGVKYNEVDPEKTGDLQKMYDFFNLADAQNFIDNVLGHKDVDITVNDAREVVYDKSTGERARTWTITKPDGTAKTYTSEAEARGAMVEGDNLRSTDTTVKDIEQMAEVGQPTGHFEVRHRVVFNPTEFVRFESEREAHEFRERLNRDDVHPNVTTRVTNVESPKTQISRANVAYTSAELQQWINRMEASPAYQSMTKDQQAEWKREMRIESARVTMTAGRRTMHLPREYAKGASTNILKNMIDFAGSNSRAIAELKYRDEIDKAVSSADAYVDMYRNQSGGLGRDHRARDEAMREIKQRLYAPIRVEDSWAIGVKRALQVSMISHLADAGYLIVNALEPWVFGAAVTAARHGWIPAYRELGIATKLVDPVALAKAAGADIAAAGRGEFRTSQYEMLLLRAVTGRGNNRGDGANLALMLKHMFQRGLVARDVGSEVERIHDPSANVAFRTMDRVDNVFRGFNTGIETLSRAMTSVANYRLEYARATKEGLKPDAAHQQAIRYAEDSIFKGAGDYSAWNNPRYFNNPFLKMATQFKKYPLRIYSVYADAAMAAVKGDREAQKQVAYMLVTQAIAAGGLGLPLASFGAGTVNAAYLLGITDDNWTDVEFSLRKKLVDSIGVEGTDLVLRGALRFSGADFSQKMSQNSIFFMGSPDSRKPRDLIETLGLASLGAPGNALVKLIDGMQKVGEAASHYSAGADSKAMQSGMEGAAGIIQIKLLHDLVKAVGMATGDKVGGLPKGQEGSTGNAIVQALGFVPTSVSNKREARQTVMREKRKDSEWRKRWVTRWVDAPNSAERSAVWAEIQKANRDLEDPGLRIQYQDLWKAERRTKQDERQDDLKLGVRLSGRQKAFADVGRYFDVE